MEPARPGTSAATVASLPRPEGPAIPVAVLVVTADAPGAHPVGEPGDAARSAVLVHGLVRPDDLGDARPDVTHDIDPGLVLRPSEEERAAAPLGLSRGADYLRVWDRASEEVVAALISDVPFTAADLSLDGILLVATERGCEGPPHPPGRPGDSLVAMQSDAPQGQDAGVRVGLGPDRPARHRRQDA